MTDLPFMRMWWADFFIDPVVRSMPPLSRGLYLLLLGESWVNGGWLKDDDKNIAARLQIDVRSWRMHRPHIEPAFERRSDPMLGSILVQKRLQIELALAVDLIEKRKAQTAPARMKRHSKSTKQPPATERPNGRATEPVADVVAGIVAKSAADPYSYKKEIITFSALPLRSGDAEKPEPDEAALAALRLKGSAPTKPTPELLKSPLLKRPKATGLMAALEPREDDDGQP